MSNGVPFALGLGGGLALWGLTRSTDRDVPSQPPPAQTTTRNCIVRVDRAGLDVDGERVQFDEAVRRCRAADSAAVTVASDAPASTCAALLTALGVASTGTPRNARRASPLPGPSRAAVSSTFTLAVYPEGVRGSRKHVQWFHASPATSWADARDRLAAANILDPDAIGPDHPGTWKLVTDPRVFKKDRAKPLPLRAAHRTRDAARASRYTLEGRTMLRDGEAILHLERVDLGDERYAISPHEADLLAERLVRLLNRHGAR